MDDVLYCVVRYNPEIQFSFCKDANKEFAISRAMDKFYDHYTYDEEGFSRYYYGTYDNVKVEPNEMKFSYTIDSYIPETTSVFDSVKEYDVHVELPKSIDIKVYGYTEEIVKKVVEMVLSHSKLYDNGIFKSELGIVPEKIVVKENNSWQWMLFCVIYIYNDKQGE